MQLQTVSLRCGVDGREWIDPNRLEADGCDWFIWGFHQRSFRADLRGVAIAPITGEALADWSSRSWSDRLRE